MQVAEHNITDWKLNKTEIDALVRLTKQEMKNSSGDKASELFYGILAGKLLIMKNTEDS